MSADPRLSAWAQRQGIELTGAPSVTDMRFALYARVSTEDLQSPEDSLARQRELAESLIADRGAITEVFFDVGHSRSLPWVRRPEASRLLGQLTSPSRQFDAVVIGEFDRAFFGNQFTETAHRFASASVPLWAPIFGGPYDPYNMSQDVQAVVTGVLSRVERQRVQERVKASMTTLAKAGRHLGGRPPYGYKVVGYAEHPNPRKAAEGFKLKRLEPDPATSPVVQRIFAEALEGHSPRAIARRLNEDEVACPSEHDRDRNSHRKADGWQQSTVRAILGNIKYTGHQVWGSTRKDYQLLDPANPSLGEVRRFVKSANPPILSAERAHEPLVSLDDFLTLDAARQANRKQPWATHAAKQRSRGAIHSSLQRMVWCTWCGRRMGCETLPSGTVRFRCRSRDLIQGTAAVHPPNIRVTEGRLLPAVLTTIESLLGQENRTRIIGELLEANTIRPWEPKKTSLVDRLSEAQVRLERVLDALEAGTLAPDLVGSRVERLQGEIAELTEQLSRETGDPEGTVNDRELLEAFDSLSAAALRNGELPELRALFESLSLRLDYTAPHEHAKLSLHLAGVELGFQIDV